MNWQRSPRPLGQGVPRPCAGARDSGDSPRGREDTQSDGSRIRRSPAEAWSRAMSSLSAVVVGASWRLHANIVFAFRCGNGSEKLAHERGAERAYYERIALAKSELASPTPDVGRIETLSRSATRHAALGVGLLRRRRCAGMVLRGPYQET